MMREGTRESGFPVIGQSSNSALARLWDQSIYCIKLHVQASRNRVTNHPGDRVSLECARRSFARLVSPLLPLAFASLCPISCMLQTLLLLQCNLRFACMKVTCRTNGFRLQTASSLQWQKEKIRLSADAALTLVRWCICDSAVQSKLPSSASSVQATAFPHHLLGPLLPLAHHPPGWFEWLSPR